MTSPDVLSSLPLVTAGLRPPCFSESMTAESSMSDDVIWNADHERARPGGCQSSLYMIMVNAIPLPTQHPGYQFVEVKKRFLRDKQLSPSNLFKPLISSYHAMRTSLSALAKTCHGKTRLDAGRCLSIDHCQAGSAVDNGKLLCRYAGMAGPGLTNESGHY